MQDTQQEAFEVSTDVMALAEAQALKDAELMAALAERKAAKKSEASGLILDAVADAEEKHARPAPVKVPMNRAQRRAQVKFYAKLLAETERQTPIVNPTIIPKSARRQRKNSRYAH